MQAGIAHIKKELIGIYPEREVESLVFLVLQHIKSYTRTQLLLSDDELLSPGERRQIADITARLKKYEPIQYILGETEFFGLMFFCRPGVLIPRPETEELVNWILEETPNSGINILDIGTGSGCIPVSIKRNLSRSRVFACDISETCLQLARENAALNQVEISYFRMDMLQSPPPEDLPCFDLLVSNPPYVRISEKAKMERNVLDYEPGTALFVPGHDPLLFYRSILSFSGKQLKRKGKIYWEINEALGQECSRLLRDTGYQNIEIRKDIHGKDRMISARKP
jgi:release factor glutamine methyltransferase